jgi:hypothetical protein
MPGPARGRAPRSVNRRGRATAVFSGVLVLLGVAVLVETAVLGGGIGYLLGALFMLAGGLRLYLSTR